MATTKKSTTTKKTSGAPKKPRTPKPKIEEPVEKIVPEEKAKPEEPKKNPVPKKEGPEYVDVFIPLDPSLADTDGQYIIGSDNGRFFQYKRGATHRLEKGHAEYILSRINGVVKLEKLVEELRYKGK